MLSLIFCSAKLWMISLNNKTNYSFCSGEWQSKGEAFGAGLSARVSDTNSAKDKGDECCSDLIHGYP